jgi:hypothetical protein
LFLKKIIPISIFVLLCLGMVELSYRYYASGDAAFSPTRFNSFNMLLLSGLIQRSQYPSVFYELKPNLDALLQGIPLKTNSAGMADNEYALIKPDDTMRVAVIGSSWTMATGVAHDSAYHSLLETELSAASKGNYEFLNFGVEYYGLRELVGTARHRAMVWDPDVIVVAITPFTARLRWDEPSETDILPEQTYPFFQSYMLRALDYIIGLGYYQRGLDNRVTLKPTEQGVYIAQIKRAINDFQQLAAEKDIPLMIMWLAYREPSTEVQQLLEELSAESDVIFVDAYNSLLGSGNKQLHSGRFNKHPNAQGHKIIAQSLKEAMLENNLLSGL